MIDVHPEENHARIQAKNRPTANPQKELKGGALAVDDLRLRGQVAQCRIEGVALNPGGVAADVHGVRGEISAAQVSACATRIRPTPFLRIFSETTIPTISTRRPDSRTSLQWAWSQPQRAPRGSSATTTRWSSLPRILARRWRTTRVSTGYPSSPAREAIAGASAGTAARTLYSLAMGVGPSGALYRTQVHPNGNPGAGPRDAGPSGRNPARPARRRSASAGRCVPWGSRRPHASSRSSPATGRSQTRP